MVFSPLGQGVLTGKYAGGARPTDSRATDDRRNRWMNSYLDSGLVERVEQLSPLAAKLDVSMAQLAIAWCLRLPSITSTIIGATTFAQLDENAGAAGLELPLEVIEAIDSPLPRTAAWLARSSIRAFEQFGQLRFQRLCPPEIRPGREVQVIREEPRAQCAVGLEEASTDVQVVDAQRVSPVRAGAH